MHDEALLSESMRHALWRIGDLSWLDHEGTTPEHRAACRALGLMDGTAPEDWAPRGQVQLDEAITAAFGRGARRFVGEIGRRWGKSHYLVRRAIKRCVEHMLTGKTPARIPYAASTGKSLEEFIFPIARGIIATAPKDMRPELVDGELRFGDGGRIPFQGCDDKHKADNLRGAAAEEVIIDEAGFIPILPYVVDSVFKFQLGTTDGMMLLFSSPAETPAHYFVKLALNAETANTYFKATIYDGPMLTPNALARLCDPDNGGPSTLALNEQEASWQREALARRVVDKVRAIVPEFALHQQNIVREVEMPAYYHAYVVGDLGYVDLTVILIAYWHFELAKIVVLDEIVLERSTSDIIQREVDRMEALYFAKGCVGRPKRVIDAQPMTRADMARAGEADDHVWVPPSKIDKAGSVNALRLDVGLERYIIHPRCQTTILHLLGGIWNERRTDFERSEGLGHFDGVDAMRYLSRTIGPAERNLNPNPPASYDETGMYVAPELKNKLTGARAAFHRPRKR